MTRGAAAQHESRRDELADAALRVVERQGVEALTFRQVAAEAGVSLGRVQHYFASRTDLIRATFDRVQRLTKDRVDAGLADAGTADSGRSVVEAILRALIPATPTQLAEHRVAQMFEALAMNDAGMLRELRAGHADLADFLAGQLSTARDHGEIDPAVDPAPAAVTLLACAEGLAGLVAIGHTPAPMAHDLLGAQLARLLGTR
ncbi:TetR/AcrR family transcriptional regulator [Prauserella oleivorans]|uniref:TetR/AcrR family transcriptional regulator n=1 Tax=Prauserella oleivorans TaxID=1478153 RepID=A0ABW5W4U7_9PSEU